MKKRLIFVGALLVVSSDIFAQQENETQIEEVTIASKTKQQLYKTEARNFVIKEAEMLGLKM